MNNTTLSGLIESVKHLNPDSSDESIELLFQHRLEQSRLMAELDEVFVLKLKEIYGSRLCAR